MEKRTHNVISRMVRALVIAAVAAVFFVLPLVGCSSGSGIAFVVDEISMCVGDSRDLFAYAVFDPPTTDDKAFSLSSSDDCVTVDGTTITAVRPGEAVVTATASGGSAAIKVRVRYHEAANIVVTHDGELVQTADGDAKPIVFYAVTDDNIDPETVIDWTVNGVAAGQGSSLDFVAKGCGEFTVTARAQDVSARSVVRIYRKTEAAGYYDGELEQARDFSPVRFYAREKVDPRNPRSVYCWTVNGEQRSSAPEFCFTPPSRGDYKIGLYVNGVKREFDGEPDVTVSAAGDRAPSCRVEFDDRGGIFVLWNDGAAARSVTVVAPDGKRSVYNSFDARYAYKFSAGSFDASELLAPYADVPGVYKISVNGDAQGETYEFLQYPSSAAPYINGAVLCRNSFITDSDEAAEWVYELYALGRSSAKCYLAREYGDGTRAAADITAAAEALGLECTATAEGNIVSVAFEAFVSAPSVATEGEQNRVWTAPPHVELYNSKNKRSKRNYVFAAERVRRSVDVQSSEQLLCAVKCGVKPVPQKGSSAEAVYNSARSALLSIIGADYTDRQKVHAIHDWLQFCTARVSLAAADNSANYIEGVFGMGETGTGAVTSLGMAKAVAYMCLFEGIECDIVNDGGHYWNKVRLDGLWYNVDAYGGELVLPGTGRECCSHSRLFVTDADMLALGLSPSGEEAYDVGAEYLEKRVYAGVCYDTYITGVGKADGENIKAAVFAAFDGQSAGDFLILTARGVTDFDLNAYGVEFMLDGALSQKEREAAVELVTSAAVAYFKEALDTTADKDAVRVSVINDVLRLTVSKKAEQNG